MSGFETIIPAAVSVASTAFSASERQARADAQAESQAEAAARQSQIVEQQRAQQEKERLSLLERQQATARARMAANGTAGDGGGSAQAILDGIADQGLDDLADINANAAVRSRASTRSSLLDDAESLSWAKSGLDVFRSFYGATDRMS